MDGDLIVRVPFQYTAEGHPPRAVRVEIGRPFEADDGEWACTAAVHGLAPELAAMRGEDGLQALLLAVNLVRNVFEDARVSGGRLMYPGTSQEVPLDAYFSTNRPRGA
jgi:hypothetical protein